MDLSVLPWGTVGPSGLLFAVVAWLVRAFLTGQIVPRSALLDAHTERDRWRDAALAAIRQNNELLTGARVTRDLLRALPDPVGEPT